jgi:hypothetical protein
MGAYRDNLLKKKAEQATDQKYFDAGEVAAAIVDALKSNGEIKKAIDNAITAAVGENGAVTTAISSAISNALGEEGAVTSAITSAISSAIGAEGSITTWADGRYEAKQA